MVKKPPAIAGDAVPIPGLGKGTREATFLSHPALSSAGGRKEKWGSSLSLGTPLGQVTCPTPKWVLFHEAQGWGSVSSGGVQLIVPLFLYRAN